MIQLAQLEAMIHTSAQQLYTYVTNMENYAEWFPGVLAIRSANSLPHGSIGKTYQESLYLGDHKATLTIEINKAEPYQLFYTEGDLEGVLPAMEMRFTEQTPSSCLFSLTYMSRCEALASDPELVKALQTDIGNRAHNALSHLQQRYSAR